MLKRIFAKFRPSPAMAVALLGVALGLGGTGWAANGGAFLLGVFNSATLRSAVVANINDSAFQVSNTSAGASAVPLLLTAAAGHPPMKVNTVTKVANLNADYVDGLDASQLTRVMRIPFTLAANTSTTPIVLPAGLPVHLMGRKRDGSSDVFMGFGQASVLNQISELMWIGAEGIDDITHVGIGSSVGTHIVYLDFNGLVDVEVAGATSIRVHNSDTNAHSGEITLVW